MVHERLPALERVRRVVRNSGAPLPQPLRASAEKRLSHRFDDVRVHYDSEAAASARQLDVPAYTFDRHVVLSCPPEGVPNGMLLHELAHVATAITRDREPQRIAQASEAAEVHAAAVASGRAAPNALNCEGVVHCFQSEEHRVLGEEASSKAMTDVDISNTATPEYLTYGEMVALAGDYFESLSAIRVEAQSTNGRDRIRWVKWWAIDQYKGVGEPALSDADKADLRNHYYKLAAKNETHFSAGGTARPTYEAQHEEAIRIAFMDASRASAPFGAGPTSVDTRPAMTQEAFAQHFLSDMFAGGHVRTERSAIKAWYETHIPNNKQQLVAYMARIMHTYLVQQHPYVNAAGYVPVVGLAVNIPSERKIQQQIRDIGGAAIDAFGLGDIVSLGWHNADNMGIDVVSDVDATGAAPVGGHKWVDVGDSQLATSATTRGMAVAAMKASISDINQAVTDGTAYGANTRPAYSPGPPLVGPGTALQATLNKLKPFKALRFLPRADPASPTNHPMVWEWGKMNSFMYDAVDKAVKGEVADTLDATANRQSDVNKRDALKEVVRQLRLQGITALETAIGSKARGTPVTAGSSGTP